jgi:hypothetical protein
VKSDHQDRNLGEEFGDLSGDINAVQIRHLIVQQNQVGRSFDYFPQSFRPGSRFTTHPPRSLLLKDRPQVVPDRGIVIDKKNTNHANPSSLGLTICFVSWAYIYLVRSCLLPGVVTLSFVLFHHRAGRHFLCPSAVAAGPFGTFLDVFVFALFFCADAAQVFLSGHDVPFHILFL